MGTEFSLGMNGVVMRLIVWIVYFWGDDGRVLEGVGKE